jgi:hypothetical protein
MIAIVLVAKMALLLNSLIKRVGNIIFKISIFKMDVFSSKENMLWLPHDPWMVNGVSVGLDYRA